MKNQVLSEVYSDYINVQSRMGFRLSDLQRVEVCDAFYRLESPWATQAEWNEIQRYFPGADKNIKDLAKGTPYTDYRSLKRAITRAGSLMHFYQIGPAWMTTQNSFDFGIQRVIQVQQEKEAQNYFVSVYFSGSAVTTQ